MTSNARNGLNARILPHENQPSMHVTSTGLLKGEHGLVIPPSSIDAAMHGNKAALTDAEKSMFGIDVEAKAQQNAQSARKTRRKTKQPEPQDIQDVHTDVTVSMLESGIDVPTQYAHVYVGTGVLVLVTNRYSYIPVKIRQTDDGLTNRLRLSGVRGTFAFMGHEFVDADGARNIILVRLPDEQPAETEEETQSDDEQTW